MFSQQISIAAEIPQDPSKDDNHLKGIHILSVFITNF